VTDCWRSIDNNIQAQSDFISDKESILHPKEEKESFKEKEGKTKKCNEERKF